MAWVAERSERFVPWAPRFRLVERVVPNALKGADRGPTSSALGRNRLTDRARNSRSGEPLESGSTLATQADIDVDRTSAVSLLLL